MLALAQMVANESVCFGRDWRVIVHCLQQDSAGKSCCKYTDKNGGGSPVAIAPSSCVDALSLTQRQREMEKLSCTVSYTVSAYAASGLNFYLSAEAVKLREGVIRWS